MSKYIGKDVDRLDLRKVVTYSRGWEKLGGAVDWRPLAMEDYLELTAQGITDRGLVRIPGPVVNSAPCDCFGGSLAVDTHLVKMWLRSLQCATRPPPWIQAWTARVRAGVTAAAILTGLEDARAEACRSESKQLGLQL